MQRDRPGRALPDRGVSILTRPEGRVQPELGLLKRVIIPSFNPHPARGSGATQVQLVGCVWAYCFNPHPARGSGATSRRSSRPSGPSSFQSSPGPRVGCNDRIGSAHGHRWALFQSSPGPRVGCNRGLRGGGAAAGFVSILTRPEGRVQPGRPVRSGLPVSVSILTRPEGRVQPVLPVSY